MKNDEKTAFNPVSNPPGRLEKLEKYEDIYQSKTKVVGLRRYIYPGPKQGMIYLAVKIRGKVYTECTGTKKVEAAKKFLADKRREIENQPEAPDASDSGQILTMAEYYKIWYERRTSEAIKPKTLLRDRTLWSGLVKCWAMVNELKSAKVGDFETCLPSDITADHLTTFKRVYLASKKWDEDTCDCDEADFKPGLGKASDSFNKTLSMLIDLFQIAVDARRIRENPATKIPRAAKSTEEVVIPAHDELPKIADKLVEIRSKDFMWFLAYTGMRQSEANHVRKQDVHWERGQGGEIWVTPKYTKGRKGKEKGRWVPIFSQARELVKKLCECANGPEGWLFRPDFSIKVGLRQACAALGLRHYTHHSFRHYFATNLLQHFNVRDAAEVLGHRDGGKLLLQTYAHYMPSNIAAKQAVVEFGALTSEAVKKVSRWSKRTPIVIPELPTNVVAIPEQDRLIAEITALAKRLTPEQRAKMGFPEPEKME